MNYSGAVHLRNQEYWEIRNLEVTNDDDFDVDIDLSRPQGDNSWSSQAETRNGILIIADGDLLNDDDDGIFDHIYIENCYVHDVDGPNDWNDTFTGGIIYNVVGTKIRPNTSFRDIRIAYNTIRKVDLLGITGFVQMAKSGYQDDVDTYNLWMEDIYITDLEFQAWNGTEYTTISTYSGTIGTSKTISLPETTSSKFKVLITGLQEDTTKNSKGQTDPSIQEIELYYR